VHEIRTLPSEISRTSLKSTTARGFQVNDLEAIFMIDAEQAPLQHNACHCSLAECSVVDDLHSNEVFHGDTSLRASYWASGAIFASFAT
jgi:hypothetical protein